MATGLFAHRAHSGGRAFAAHRARNASTIERLADCLAEGDGNVHACALQLGISYTYAEAVFQRMRKRLGARAI